MTKYRRYAVLLVLAVVLIGGLVFSAGLKPASAAPTANCIYHQVWSGQTLSQIGAMYGVNWVAIAQVNGLWNPNYIQSGWVLCIPTGYGVGGAYTPYTPYYGTGGQYVNYYPYYANYGYGYPYYNNYYNNYYYNYPYYQYPYWR